MSWETVQSLASLALFITVNCVCLQLFRMSLGGWLVSNEIVTALEMVVNEIDGIKPHASEKAAQYQRCLMHLRDIEAPKDGVSSIFMPRSLRPDAVAENLERVKKFAEETHAYYVELSKEWAQKGITPALWKEWQLREQKRI